MDQETIQKAAEAIQRIMKPIVETITRLWEAFKDRVTKNPDVVKLLRRGMATRSETRSLFKPHQAMSLPTVKSFNSQITYWPPVPRLARSSC